MSFKPRIPYRQTCCPRTSRGFTLAEVVVAVLLFGLAAAVLGQAVSDSLRAYAMSREAVSASDSETHVRRHVLGILSRSTLEEGGEVEVPVAIRKQDSEEVETEMVKVRWEAEIFPTRLLDVYVLRVTMRLEGGSDVGEVTHDYIAYRPSWAKQDEVDSLLESKEKEFRDRLSARGGIESGEGST